MTLALLSAGRRRVLGIGAFVALLTLAFGIGGVLAQSTYTVSQKHRAFHPGILHVVAGDVVHVVNDDEFTHQIYVDSPTFKFDSDEAAPGESIDIKFTQAGTFLVQCHIHPRMRLQVIVTAK